MVINASLVAIANTKNVKKSPDFLVTEKSYKCAISIVKCLLYTNQQNI